MPRVETDTAQAERHKPATNNTANGQSNAIFYLTRQFKHGTPSV